MMKLSTMLKVANTVDSEWRSPLAEKILAPWGKYEGAVYALRYSANFIFVFKKDEKTYYLRFNDTSERELQSLEAEMKVLEYLSNTSLRVVQPVLSLNNKKIEVVETELGTFYAVVFEALSGKQYEIEELEEEQYTTWGSSLGKLHEAFKGMDENISAGRPSWREHLSFVEKILPDHEVAAKKELVQLLNWAEQLPVSKENYGLIHFDFELDNQRWENGNVGMLDFDDCTHYWYVADIAFSLRDMDKRDSDNSFFQKFMEGYQKETTVDQKLLEHLPMFSRVHDLFMFARLLRSVDIAESADNPEWLTNLRIKLVKMISNYRNSFNQLTKEYIE